MHAADGLSFAQELPGRVAREQLDSALDARMGSPSFESALERPPGPALGCVAVTVVSAILTVALAHRLRRRRRVGDEPFRARDGEHPAGGETARTGRDGSSDRRRPTGLPRTAGETDRPRKGTPLRLPSHTHQALRGDRVGEGRLPRGDPSAPDAPHGLDIWID